MQTFKICIVLLLVAAAIIEAAEVQRNNGFKLFKRKPLAAKHDDVQGSGRMVSSDMMNKIMSLFNKKQSQPMMMVVMQPADKIPDTTDATIPFSTPESASESDMSPSEPDMSPPDDTNTTTPTNRTLETYQNSNRTPSKIVLGNDESINALDDDDQIIFQLDDENPLNGVGDNDDSLDDDEDDYYNDNENGDSDIVNYQPYNDDSDVDENLNNGFILVESGLKLAKKKDCDQSDGSSIELGRATKRQKQMKRRKQLKRQKQIKKRKRQQQIRRRKQQKRNRRRRLQRRRRIQQMNSNPRVQVIKFQT